MPVYNVTVKDISPLISYSDGWTDATSGDAAASEYVNSRFHFTKLADAFATFSFYGTACYFVGAKRSNHGRFTVTLDGVTTTASGFSSEDVFQQTLFSKTDLPLANHTLTITNGDSNDQDVDIDYLVFTTGDSKMDTPSNFTFDDTDTTRISYSGNDWTLQNSGITAGQYHNSTFHTTTKSKAQATINFEGNAAYVFGGTDKSHGTYTVAVDGGEAMTLNATTMNQVNFQVLLYYTGSLSSGKHTMVLTNLQDNLALDIDFVSAITFADSFNSPASPANPRGTAKTPLIAGTISGVCIAIAWIVALVWFFMRRRKRRARMGNLLDGETGTDAYIIPPDPAVISGIAPAGTYAQPDSNDTIYMSGMRRKGANNGVRQANQDTDYSNQQMNASNYSSSYDPSSASGSRSEYPPSPEQQAFDDHTRRRLPTVPRTVSSTGSEKSGEHEGRSNQPAPASGGSDVRIPIPPERQQELAASRMRMPDRPQDWGPIHEEDLLNLELPPNYQQATEPLPTSVGAPISSSSAGSGGEPRQGPQISPS